MDSEHSFMAANAIVYAADACRNRFVELCSEMDRPSAIYRPALSRDGDKWIALYGANLQEGVVGIGDSPAAAMWDFDKAWSIKVNSEKQNGK